MPKAVIIGVGPDRGLGAQLCKRFAREELDVVAAGRTQAALDAVVADIERSGGKASAVVADATNEADMAALFDHAGADVDLAIYNAGNNTAGRILEMEADYFENSWRVVCFGGFLFGREALRRMVPQKRGTILFTGASASLRGRAGYGAFNSAKAALRTFAQAMAKEYGPEEFTSATSSSTVPSTAIKSADAFRTPTRAATGCSISRASWNATPSSTGSTTRPGRSRSTCGRRWSLGEPAPTTGIGQFGAGRPALRSLQHLPAFHDEDRVLDTAQAKFVGATMAGRPLEPFGADHDGVGDHLIGDAPGGAARGGRSGSLEACPRHRRIGSDRNHRGNGDSSADPDKFHD